MAKMRLGGIRASDKHACLTSLCRSGKDTFGDICSRLAADRINLGFFTHIADLGTRETITCACTEEADGFSSFIHWKASHGDCNIGRLVTDISMVSLFPHEQKLSVTGSLIAILARKGIVPHGIASSPSALTTLLGSSDVEDISDGLFDTFEFRSYASPRDWQAVRRDQETPLKEVVCSYQEEVIKIYNITHYIDLDLWNIVLPFEHLGDFAGGLSELHELVRRMPFLVATTSRDRGKICFSLCLAAAYRDPVRQVLHERLSGVDLFCLGPVSLFFLVGPHFGDRYGIANTLLIAMKTAGIPIMAFGYAVSSFSFVIQGNDPNPTIEALNSTFEIPGRGP